MLGRAVLLAFVATAAGCLGAPVRIGDGPAEPPLPAFLPPVAVSRTAPGAEPVVAVASDGTVYVEGVGSTVVDPTGARTNVNKVWRSTDGGDTWTDITPAGPGQERSNDGFVAVGNGDTVYAANVFQLTFQVYRSDDRGASWRPLNVPRLPLLMHRHWIVPTGPSTVHLAVEALPPEFLTFFAGRPPPTDPLGTPNQGLWYARSDDRGDSWTAPVLIDPNVNFAGQGNLVVDGEHLYVVRYEEPGRSAYGQTYESGRWYLIASHDGGRSWKRSEMFALTSELAAAIPATTVDEDGMVYAVWSQELAGSSRLHYAWSTNHGATWAAPRPLAVANGTHAMPWVAARAPGVLGVMWYHAEAEGRASKLDAPWSVEYALVERAATDGPTARTARVTPEPIHEGNVCAKGPACGAGEDRRLLDYPWMVYGPGGTAHVAFASTQWDRPSAFAVFAREAAALPS